MAPVRPLTGTGVFDLVFVPLPRRPLVFSPQHFTVASDSRAHVWVPPPEAIAVAPVRLLTATGAFESVFVPSPSSPTSLCPQHFAVASESSAHVCPKPPAIAVAP